jgi:hypothetical protein
MTFSVPSLGQGARREPNPGGSVSAAFAADRLAHSTVITLRLNQGMGLFDALFAHAILELAEDANVGVVLER